MGLTIHYTGSIRNYSLVDELTEEVKDICESLNWNYRLWDERKPITGVDFKGISISPEGCEPVFFTFLPGRKLVSPLKLLIKDIDPEELMFHTIHTKTQYAGPDVHIALIKLLLYIKDKYMEVLEVQDEGMYWETGNEKVLYSQFEKYEFLINQVASALTEIKRIPGETPESITERIEKLLRAKFRAKK